MSKNIDYLLKESYYSNSRIICYKIDSKRLFCIGETFVGSKNINPIYTQKVWNIYETNIVSQESIYYLKNIIKIIFEDKWKINFRERNNIKNYLKKYLTNDSRKELETILDNMDEEYIKTLENKDIN